MFRSLTLKRKITTYQRRVDDKSDFGKLPKEALTCIFQLSDNATLSSALKVCKKWKRIGHQVAQERLVSEHLTIILEQEGRLRFTLDYFFAGFNPTTQVCTFHTLPKKFKYYHGTSRKPNLASISKDGSGSTSIITDKPISLDVKEAGLKSVVNQQSWKLNYFVEKETAFFRRSERWITPLSFDCQLESLVSKAPVVSWVRRVSLLRRNTTKSGKKPVKDQTPSSGIGLSRAKTFPQFKFSNNVAISS
ncbi:hypothetical protein K7432_002455 [Basidiobolus ranarum]|uniref:F-box domain-containing protein n=1 Tax=Basidiobolus ranarum TaxID=34480 RepID=A0ABR2X1G9_9FUNG